jgi:YgiT-type zinc finger domain-containing protein
MIETSQITECPLCGSQNIEHILGDHVSKIRGTAHNVPQTICHDCGEVFLGPDSLEVIQTHERQEKCAQHYSQTPNLVHT